MKNVNIHKQTKNQDQIHADDFVWKVAMAPISAEKQALRVELDWWGKLGYSLFCGKNPEKQAWFIAGI